MIKRALVYVIINSVNGNKYIGVTSRSLRRRWVEHVCRATKGQSSPLYKAIRKYGRASFEMMEICRCDSIELALKEEIRLIDEIKPRYNLSKGGGGRLGVGLSEAGKQSLSAAHKGNIYRLGKNHTDEAKLLLKLAAAKPSSVAMWKKNAPLGPASLSKQVVCLDDGAEFPSASCAAAHYGVSKSALIELCLGRRWRKSVGGKRFAYKGYLQ